MRTGAAYEAEARQRARAEASFRQARKAVDFISQIAAEELRDRPDLQEVRRKLLEAALAYYQEFIDQCGDDPSLQAELASSHVWVAGILHAIGSKAEAQAARERAVKILETLPPDRGRPGGFPPGGLPESSTLPLLVQKPLQEELNLSEEPAGP